MSPKSPVMRCALRGPPDPDDLPARAQPDSRSHMSRVILFNKPMGVLSQFTDAKSPTERPTLSGFDLPKGVYAAGRLDRDSEGLLVLTDNGKLQARIASPRTKTEKTYLVQLEGDPTEADLAQLCAGVTLKDGPAKAVRARAIDPPDLWPRVPPVRFRKSVLDSWAKIVLTEGRNRQVRRMTAAIGYPTLRLVRWRIGDWSLDDMQPGEWRDA